MPVLSYYWFKLLTKQEANDINLPSIVLHPSGRISLIPEWNILDSNEKLRSQGTRVSSTGRGETRAPSIGRGETRASSIGRGTLNKPHRSHATGASFRSSSARLR